MKKLAKGQAQSRREGLKLQLQLQRRLALPCVKHTSMFKQEERFSQLKVTRKASTLTHTRSGFLRPFYCTSVQMERDLYDELRIERAGKEHQAGNTLLFQLEKFRFFLQLNWVTNLTPGKDYTEQAMSFLSSYSPKKRKRKSLLFSTRKGRTKAVSGSSQWLVR